MFEKASRLKLRFESPKGSLMVEDLWDLPLTSAAGRANLNDIAKVLNRQLKEIGDEDFVTKAKKSDEILQLKFELVKCIIVTRLTENEAAAQAADRKEKKQRLLDLIAKKQDQELESKSLDELRAMVNGI